MKNTLLSFALFMWCCIIFFNCKKEKAEPIDISGNNPQNISTDSIDGVLNVTRDFYLDNNDSLVFFNNRASAVFFQVKASKTYTMSPQTVYVGNVSLNGVQFSALSGSSYYSYVDTTVTSFTTPYNWQIQGANGYLGFNVTENIDFPTYTNGNTLHDTLMINQQDTIDIGAYSGTTARIIIQGSTGYIIKTLEYPSSSVIIFPHEYSDVGIIDGNTSIYGYINKNYYKPINGKMYRFTSTISFSKPIYLKSQ